MSVLWPLLLASASATAALPPYAGAYQPQTVDERGVWMMADEDERRLRDSSFMIDDPALKSYVRGVLCRTVGAERCAGVRLYIERVPAFNASMMPNGTLQIWSGLLLRLRDEAELAAILGHEFAHFEQRHTLAGYRQQRGASDVFAWAGLLGGGYAPSIREGAVGSVYAFGPAQETQADVLSARYIGASGYDQRCFADVWSRMMDEADATAAGRKQRSKRYDRVPFFSTHPTNLDRATYLREIAAKGSPGGDTNDAAFAQAMKPWRAEFLADQLKLNDFGGTEYLLEQLAERGWTEDLLFARGELYRARGNPRDLVTATGFYREAIAIEPAHAESYRGLGLALMRSGETAEAKTMLGRYLQAKPAASDAAMILTLIS